MGELKKIIIVGPGAMGCLFAGLLASPEREIWLLGKDPERALALERRGIVIERAGGKVTHQVKATADPVRAGVADLIIICVKAYDTRAAAQTLGPAMGPDTNVLSLQNGLGNVEVLTDLFGPERTLGGTTAQGANLVAPGHVRHAGVGETVIGQPQGGVERAQRVAVLFRAGGIEARATADLPGLIWSKLVINAALNPLTAILGVKNGVLAETPAARAIIGQAVNEAVSVCQAKGITLLFPDPVEKALAVARATAENISSMFADVRARKKTEIVQINGAVARAAQELGIDAPVNATLAGMVSALEQTYRVKV